MGKEYRLKYIYILYFFEKVYQKDIIYMEEDVYNILKERWRLWIL